MMLHFTTVPLVTHIIHAKAPANHFVIILRASRLERGFMSRVLAVLTSQRSSPNRF